MRALRCLRPVVRTKWQHCWPSAATLCTSGGWSSSVGVAFAGLQRCTTRYTSSRSGNDGGAGGTGPSVDLEIGSVLKLESLFDESAVTTFAQVSGDHNPIHLDHVYAATTTFGRPIAHGMLVASMFSTVFASNIPGAIYLGQDLKFKAPVFVGERVRATVTVQELHTVRSGARIATCETVCTVIDGISASALAIATVPGRVAITGQARVLCPTMVIGLPD